MNRLAEALKKMTLGDVLQSLKDMSLLSAILSFTGIAAVIELFAALFAAVSGSRENTERHLGGALVSLLVNVLLTVLSAERDE